MKLIVGLGNVGARFEKTYHNLGFLTIDYLAKGFGVELTKKKFDAVFCVTEYKGEQVILFKPTTMMNLSGRAVEKIVNFYNIAESDIVVIYDEVDIEKGKIKYKQKGSGGTHKGMRDVVYHIGESFKRIKIGIGKPPPFFDLANFVLSRMSSVEEELFSLAIKAAAEKALEVIFC